MWRIRAIKPSVHEMIKEISQDELDYNVRLNNIYDNIQFLKRALIK